ncbi:MAG TPA: HTTM domain-containing protein [Kofleriaceae bacterium]
MAKKRKKSGPAKKPVVKPAANPAATAAEVAPVEAPPAAKPSSRGAQRRQAARHERRMNPASSLGPAEDPTFWFGFEITWAKLALARVVVFALLAIDALRQIEHAPRYGAGDFNVAQLPLLDALAPGRVLYSVSELVLAYLFVLVACGVLTRYVLPIATALYGWLYFSSHLDSYQHHYLVWLILLLACFVPWQRPATGDAETRVAPSTPVRSWALRLIYVQLAILYLWAAISKMNVAWLDGSTLAGQMTGRVRSLIDATVHLKGAAVIVILVELVLAATVWNKRTWFIAAPLGIALHAGILATSLDIGLFAWLMLGLYILVVPDRVWLALAEWRPLDTLRSVFGVIGGWFDGAMQWLVWIFAAAISLLLAGISRFDHGFAVGVVLLGTLLVVTIALRKRVSIAALAIAHLLALGTWTIVDRTTKTASDYYRLWGGSAKRLGDPKTSEYAYRRMTEIAPDEGGGHYQLGKLLLDRKADDEGIAELHKAQDLEPLKARAYLAEARWLATKGRTDEAIAKAREATIVEPNDQEASSLLNSLLPK